MKQGIYKSNGETFYEVTFISGENDYIIDEKPTTHTAIVYCTGCWFICISIDGQEANSLGYRNPKTAGKNAWIIK